jgi:TRAP-type uncharacterized transport system fused permease subunit
MWQALKYALPAFLVPVTFVLTGPGEYLLGRGPVWGVVWTSAVAGLAVAALAVATGGWVLGLGPAGTPERIATAAGGLLLLYLHPVAVTAGVTLLVAALVSVALRRRNRSGYPASV